LLPQSFPKVFSIAKALIKGVLAAHAERSPRTKNCDTLCRIAELDMSVSAPAAHLLRFDIFELDLRAGELRKRGVKLRLQGQPLEVLAILLQRAGDVVTREELRAQIWPADTFVDFDHILHNAIARIRETLGDSAETPRYIETLPRRGYRFIAQAEQVQSPRISPESNNQTGEAVAVETRTNRRTGLLLTLCACCAIGLAAWMAWQRFYVKRVVPPIRSIAVLPLQNLSGDAAQEYFADGMTEELITEMSRIQALKVISRTSVMEYKGSKKHLPQIARELGADGIVEGSVLREGDQIRITVQLLDGPNDRHLWSEDYQRPLRGILTLQREIAQAIAQQIRIKLTPQQQARLGPAHAVNPEAYEAYLRGRFYITTDFSTLQKLNTAKSYFEESIRKDPGFALAYSGLADSYVYLAFFRHLPPEKAFRSAKEALRKALELDDSLGEAHTTLALLNWQFDWDRAAAEREFNYAIALAPSYDCARAAHSGYLAWSGRRAEALAETTRGRELNPGSSFASGESAIYYQLRDYPSLVEASRRGVASDPNEWLEHYFLGVGYEGLGKPAEAIPEYQRAIEMSDGDQDPTAALAHAYAVLGKRAKAEKILGELERRSKTAYVSPYMIVTIYAGLGNKDKAFEFLEKAYQERSSDIAWQIKADLRIDNLRSDPRFQNLLRRVGLTN
jgi:TolB-like protein/DNA-binding winged helix-turn-helix (wHTH) protein/Flp pilus assembly protein TadD